MIRDDEVMLKELRDITRDKECWKSSIGYVAACLDDDSSDEVKAKALWLLGEMGLKHPEKIDAYVDDIASYIDDDNPKLRERSANALGRIGRANHKLAVPYLDRLMELRHDESANVKHSFVSSDKVRIEAPEMFRVIGKRKPEHVVPYIERLEWICENDENRIVRIHCRGAIRATEKSLKKKQ